MSKSARAAKKRKQQKQQRKIDPMNIDPEMIQKMAKEIASEHMDKITSKFNADGSMPGGGACNVPPTQPSAQPRERNFPAQEQMKFTRDNMEQVVENAQTITCDECNGHVFISVAIIKRISPLMSPTGEEIIMPIQTYQCASCKHLNEKFLPARAVTDVKTKAPKAAKATRKKTKTAKSK